MNQRSSAVSLDRGRRLRNILHALASARFPRLRGEDLRLARLQWTAQLLGRGIASSKELTDAEISRCVHALLRQVPEAEARRFRGAVRGLSSKFQVSSSKSEEKKPGTWNLEPGTVLQFPNRSAISKEQLWKIHQIESWMGWDLQVRNAECGMENAEVYISHCRLQGFLESQFHVRQPEQLTATQAWRAIEALLNVAARVKSRPLAEVKEELRWWRPEEMRNAECGMRNEDLRSETPHSALHTPHSDDDGPEAA